MSIYDSSKGAVRSLVGAVAKEVAPTGIRVNAIAPGTIATQLTRQTGNRSRNFRTSGIEQEIPMQRLGEPNEIGQACVFLVI